MNNIQLILAQLRDPDSEVRLKACDQLGLEPELPPDAIVILKQALYDPEPRVAQGARRALSAHGQNNVNTSSPTGIQPNSTPSADKPSLIGNLTLGHWLFLIVGIIMIILIGNSGGGWGVLFILLFMMGCLTIPGVISWNRQKKLIETWSDFAQRTGLELNRGRSYLIGNSIPPSLSGIYRQRQVSISKYVQDEAAYEGTIPVVFTCMLLDVKNPGGASLTINPKSSLERIFKKGGITSGDQHLDEHFQYAGHPDDLLQKSLQLIAQHCVLFDRPNEVIMRTDDPLSWTYWRALSIHLDGSQLICMQSGVPTGVPAQVQLLNLLCDLAELVEESGNNNDYDGRK